MRGIPSSFLIFFFIFIFSIELISYLGFRILVGNLKKKRRTCLMLCFGFISLLFSGLLIYAFANPQLIRQSHNYTFFFIVITLSIANLFPKSFFSLVTLFSFPFRWFMGINRQRILLAGSFLLSIGIALIIFYGVFFGRYLIRVEKQNLYFADFPKQLEGLKIVQLSDIHLGSFGKNPKVLQETIKQINEIKPDLLLFTGDIVNNFADEMDGFESYLNQLQAKYGKFAIAGNHDYGDYSNWPDSVSKEQNLLRIREGLTRVGFKLLLNQWSSVKIKDTSICIVGVENWGRPPFPQYARLDLAMNGIPVNSFDILMSHDPAYWQAKVVHQTNIPLTLSGHTHGGQFGIKLAGIEFSPIWLIQKDWGGLYRSGNQYLYVNRGLGTVGFPGRIEMKPEITVLTLFRTKSH